MYMFTFLRVKFYQGAFVSLKTFSSSHSSVLPICQLRLLSAFLSPDFDVFVLLISACITFFFIDLHMVDIYRPLSNFRFLALLCLFAHLLIITIIRGFILKIIKTSLL